MNTAAKKVAYVDPDLVCEYPIGYVDETAQKRLDKDWRFESVADYRLRIAKMLSVDEDFPNDYEWKSVLERRDDVRTYLEEQGYVIDATPQARIRDIENTLGFPLSSDLYKDTDFRRTAFVNGFWGMVEAPHVPILQKKLEENARDDAHVLDIGCGSANTGKYDYEKYARNITYADIDEKHLQKLRDTMMRNPTVRRTYALANKDCLLEHFQPESFNLVIRTGVRDTTYEEMESLQSVLRTDGTVFVSNSIQRQPIDTFLERIQPFFRQTQVHVGYERYALVLQK